MSNFIVAPTSSDLQENVWIDACSIQEVVISRGNTDPEVYIVSVKTFVGTYEWSRSTTLSAAQFVTESLLNVDCCECKKGCC